MINSILEALPFFLQTAPAIKAGYQGVDLKQQKKTAGKMNQLAGQGAQLAHAQYDMNSPLFQNLYNQEKQSGQQDLAATIAEIGRQNRKLTSLGRRPLLDAERGGESVFRNLIMGQQEVGNQARENAFTQLLRGQNATAAAQNSYSNVYDAYSGLAKNKFANNLLNVGANYSLGDVLKNAFGLGQNNSPETIYWNQAGPSTPQGWTTR